MENNYGPAVSSSKPSFSSSSFSNSIGSIGENIFSTKNFLIVVLVILLIFSLLGINILGIVGNFFTSLVLLLKPLVLQILSIFGYVTGTVIDKSADILHTGGDLLVNASAPNLNNQGAIINNQPMPDSTTNPIQNPIASSKTNWCLVGEYEGRRGCIAITDQDKCLSGQVFPNQQMCLNPTLNTPTSPLKSIPE
uniref:Uncharacterized protein n=1 Tax=viral metagenome TaxID=1070528 RepID=A0A6C0D1Q8_9ZZZZ